VIIVLISFSAFKINVLIYKLDPYVSKKSLKRDLQTSGAVNPFDYGFDIAIGT